MNIAKAKDWIDMYLDMCDGEYRQRIHTGEGVLIVPLEIFGALVSSGILETVGRDKMAYFFNGDFGRTFVTVKPFDSAKRRNGVALRVVDYKRQKENILTYANKFGMSDAQTFDELPEPLKTELLSLPYSAIVRPLILSEKRRDASRLAVKYGVMYRTVYKWLNGC